MPNRPWGEVAIARGLDDREPGMACSEWINFVLWLDESMGNAEKNDGDVFRGCAAAYRLVFHKLRELQGDGY